MRFLVLQHVDREGPGLLADYFSRAGVTIDTVEIWRRQSIPPLKAYQALIVMGGPNGVNDQPGEYPSKDAELTTIRQAIAQDLPMLGICLGSQLLAAALGARVYSNPGGKEMGMARVQLTPAARRDTLFKGLGNAVDVLEWHGDVFDLPRQARLLATNSACPHQAFVYKRAYGLLFHVEATPLMVERWLEADRAWVHTPHRCDEAALLAAVREKAPVLQEASRKLSENFLDLVAGNRSSH